MRKPPLKMADEEASDAAADLCAARAARDHAAKARLTCSYAQAFSERIASLLAAAEARLQEADAAANDDALASEAYRSGALAQCVGYLNDFFRHVLAPRADNPDAPCMVAMAHGDDIDLRSARPWSPRNSPPGRTR
jgi:hypothetical protein